MVFDISLPLNMQIYAEMIGNVMIDARSTGKYYHCKFTNTKFTSLFSTFLAISLQSDVTDEKEFFHSYMDNFLEVEE